MRSFKKPLPMEEKKYLKMYRDGDETAEKLIEHNLPVWWRIL